MSDLSPLFPLHSKQNSAPREEFLCAATVKCGLCLPRLFNEHMASVGAVSAQIFIAVCAFEQHTGALSIFLPFSRELLQLLRHFKDHSVYCPCTWLAQGRGVVKLPVWREKAFASSSQCCLTLLGLAVAPLCLCVLLHHYKHHMASEPQEACCGSQTDEKSELHK